MHRRRNGWDLVFLIPEHILSVYKTPIWIFPISLYLCVRQGKTPGPTNHPVTGNAGFLVKIFKPKNKKSTMKKVFAILAITGTLIACNNKSDKKTGQKDSTKMENNMTPDSSKMQNKMGADSTKMGSDSTKMN